MGRARSGILDGARRALAESGPRGLTMTAVAERGGVAKATVYNHFRDRSELVAALAVDTVERLAAATLDAPDLAAALARVGSAAARLPELRGALAHDPSVAALLTVPGPGPAWAAAEEAALALAARHGVDAAGPGAGWLLRWVAGVAVAAPGDAVVAAEAALVARGLGAATD